ncbi:MAG: hypothetical protein IPK29_15585 [Betaproteobacteria bacterium]|nr:hypothetical protein [Betaproteobacteria bacterium]
MLRCIKGRWSRCWAARRAARAGAGERLPACDLQCPLMSLPYALGTTPQDIPAPPRLQVPAAVLQAWQSRLDAQSGAQAGPPTGPRIGPA